MFKAIGHADYESLRTLAKAFIGTENDPAALLSLNYVFSSPLELRNLSLAEVQALLTLYLDYIRLLNRLRCDKSLDEDSNRQRLFGFQTLGDDRYLAPKGTLLHERLASKSSSSWKSADGYRCGYHELNRSIVHLISDLIRDRAVMQNNACRDVHGFSPCLHLLAKKRCKPPEGKGPCAFQHVQLDQLGVGWYHARLRLILLQFQILNSARYYDWHVTKYALAHPSIDACGCS